MTLVHTDAERVAAPVERNVTAVLASSQQTTLALALRRDHVALAFDLAAAWRVQGDTGNADRMRELGRRIARALADVPAAFTVADAALLAAAAIRCGLVDAAEREQARALSLVMLRALAPGALVARYVVTAAGLDALTDGTPDVPDLEEDSSRPYGVRLVERGG